MQNIPYMRRVSNLGARILDAATFKLSSFFRVGPWYCVQCGTRELICPIKKRSVATYDPQDAKSDDAESAGNYIRTSESLIMRRNRAKRYSEKYRDGVVQKIIAGSATISQLGHELNLTERDLVDWIADDLARKQERIDELTAILKSIQMAHNGQARLGNETPVYTSDGAETIDGDYRQS